MRITFLGHQGWLFEHKGRSFLLDPILEEIGNGADKLPVWPPRRLEFSRMGPLQAVIISHEHADHFSLETLAALPRPCRIYISDLASAAMGTAIEELGFSVERFSALNVFFIVAGVEVIPLPALYNKLEPDVYALLVRDDGGASFLTAIDTVSHPDIFAWLAQNCPQRTLDNLTNNFVEPRQPLFDDEHSYTKSRATVAANMMEFVQKFRPKRAVISGQGWCFKGSRAKFNQGYFSVDNAWLTQAAGQLAPHVKWYEGAPGMRFDLTGHTICLGQSDVITPRQSMDRTFDPKAVRASEPFPPWTLVREIPAERLAAVQRFICEEYGQILAAHAPRVIERLYYLKFQDVRNLMPTMGISLRNGTSRTLLELDYGRLSFSPAPATRKPGPSLGFEIWASDFEWLLAAKEESFLICESAVRTWSHVPGFLDAAPLSECFIWFTPRFRPKETLAFYRSQIAGLHLERSEAQRSLA